MHRHVFPLASALALVTACGTGTTPAADDPTIAMVDFPAPIRKKQEKRKFLRVRRTEDLAQKKAEPKAAETPERKLGDFHVYQYTGSFSKQPVMLTEQVVAEENGILVVDFVLQENQAMSAMRVRMQRDGEPVSVVHIGASGESPGTLAEYEALIDKTQLVPDTNDEKLASEKTSCLVGDEQVECEVTTYRVTFGTEMATLTITRSEKLPGRDIGGDVVGEDGKVLYSARLVERGNEPPVVEALARMDRFTPTGP